MDFCVGDRVRSVGHWSDHFLVKSSEFSLQNVTIGRASTRM